MSRISELTFDALRGPKVGVGEVVTPSLVDAAAERVLGREDETTAESVRQMWAQDQTSEVTRMLHAAATYQRYRSKFASATRIKANIDTVLTEVQVRMLTNTHPDYELTFNFNSGHDHSMAAAVRKLGTMGCQREMVPHRSYVDFGGSLMSHINVGDTDCVVVGDIIDVKDPQRAAMQEMRLRTLAKAGVAAGHSPASVSMAQSVIRGEDKYFHKGRLETFTGKYLCGMMVHVYDVPIVQIPLMMERCEMELFVGVLHFSNSFFEQDQGDLPTIGGRYLIDRRADTFSMGFVDSPAAWYKHKWSEYQRYGADQILCGKYKRYSYKIVERRGETIKFRVLRVSGTALPNHQQYYATPTVDTVEVSTFMLEQSSKHVKPTLAPVKHLYPADVFNKLVRAAAVDASRGVLDYHELLNTYRTIAAGDKFNGVDTTVGTVDAMRVPDMVANAAVYAVAELSRLRAGIKMAIGIELDTQAAWTEDVVTLCFGAFLGAASAVVGASLQPFLTGLQRVAMRGGKYLFNHLVTVRPTPRYRRIPVSAYCSTATDGIDNAPVDFSFASQMAQMTDLTKCLNELAAKEDEAAKVKLAGVVTVDGSVVGSETLVASEGSVAEEGKPGDAPAWMPMDRTHGDRAEVYYHNTHTASAEEMRMAIREEIEAVQMEQTQVEAWMAERFAQVVVGGVVNVDLLRKKREAWKDMDIWTVREGVLIKSFLGRSLEDVQHGGVYCPVPQRVVDADGKHSISSVVPLQDVTWEGTKDGVATVRVHKTMVDSEYSGLVVTADNTKVYNGPQLIAGLRAALKCSFSFETGVYAGGPGCGKTFKITNNYNKGNIVTSPLVMSIKDVRAALVKKRKVTERGATDIAKTLDAWLCKRGRQGATARSMPQVELMSCDEVFAARYARVIAVAALLGVSRLVGYGDAKQIPPVDSSNLVRLFAEYKPEHIVKVFIVYRSVAEVLATYNHHYHNELRTVNKAKVGEVVLLRDPALYEPSFEDYLVLAMYQERKSEIKRLYKRLAKHTSTTHEAQGKSVDEVVLMQLDVRKRDKNDRFDLYADHNYLNVAFSRAKYKLTYVCAGADDEAVKWIGYAKDPRRVAMCKDLSTVGQTYDFPEDVATSS